MKVKLSSSDRCAIDVVLNERIADGSVSEHCLDKQASSIKKRVEKVEVLFDLMSQMPVSEPPTQLAARTLKFIQRHEHDAIITPHAPKETIISHPMLLRPLQ